MAPDCVCRSPLCNGFNGGHRGTKSDMSHECEDTSEDTYKSTLCLALGLNQDVTIVSVFWPE